MIPVILLLLGAVSATAADDLTSKAMAILNKNCITCHGAGLKMSNLDLRTRESALKGGDHGPALFATRPVRSKLYRLAAHEQNPTMPPGQKLADADLAVLREWLEAGAEWPAAPLTEAEAAAKAAMAKMEERPITDEERKFWSFQAVRRPAVPTGPKNPVDAFLAATWKAKGLKPMPQANPRTLVRRAYLDLTGLPPTPEEVKAYLDDRSPKAWDNLVERLLGSPHYGERWARHWLDLARYADSGGYEYDNDRNNAWRYRDYVVAAFNKDKPYDEFIREQLAGDEYKPDSPEAHVATGFLRLGPENNIKNEQTRQDDLDDITVTTSLSFLGMTLGCARCHNHKFDPIPQKDYYRIQAVFFSTKARDYPLVDADVVTRFDEVQKRIDGLQDPLKKAKTKLEKPYRDQIFEEKVAKLAPYMQEAWRTPAAKRTEGQKLNANQIEKTLKIEDDEITARMTDADKAEQKRLAAEIRTLDKQRPEKYASAMAITEPRNAMPSYFLHRGGIGSKGSVMEPGVLTVAKLGEIPVIAPPADAKTSYRRRNFAEWVASKDNPLTPRVMVNRIWQRHFGEGIVSTPNNFGRKGEAPTHPELLDWLASEFMANGWSVKHMHRVMMKSDAYRMSADDSEANAKVDGTNRFVWRMPRQRLDIETIRDNMMAVSGTLDLTTGGPAVYPYIDPALYASSSKRTWLGKPDNDASTWRRSLYVFSKRTIRYPMFESFDQPDTITSCARRNSSVTAPQALLFMNNAMVRMQAAKFADRLRREAGDDAARQVDRAFELGLARKPSQAESERSVAYIKASATGLADFCQAMFNLSEFVYTP